MNTLRIDKEYFFIFETSDLLSALFLISGILIMLNNMKRESLKNKLAKVLSRAVTLSLILLAVTSIFLHTKLSLEYDLLLLLLSVLIPSLSIILFKVLGITSDFNVTKREERVKLFGVMGMTFLLALLLSFKTGDIRLITIYTTLNLTFLLGLLITLFEKISFHMIWSMLSIFFIIYLWQIPYLYLLLLLIPLIGWSRLQLKRHTLRQVILGFLLTSICILLVLTFLKF
jgi:membrane-associated phospholipid phosphatase